MPDLESFLETHFFAPTLQTGFASNCVLTSNQENEIVVYADGLLEFQRGNPPIVGPGGVVQPAVPWSIRGGLRATFSDRVMPANQRFDHARPESLRITLTAWDPTSGLSPLTITLEWFGMRAFLLVRGIFSGVLVATGSGIFQNAAYLIAVRVPRDIEQ